MVCRHCGIEFDTTGITGDTVRCPRCGTLYRRKAPSAARDPRAGLTVPVFIVKGQPVPDSPPVRNIPQPVKPPQGAAVRENENRNEYPGPAANRPAAPKRKKTHHVRTAILLTLLLVIVLSVLALTGIGDIFPRPADEVPADPAETEWLSDVKGEPILLYNDHLIS